MAISSGPRAPRLLLPSRRHLSISLASTTSTRSSMTRSRPGSCLAPSCSSAAATPWSSARRTATARIEPAREPMTVDTIFDLASLTKVVATTTAVMMLVEDGRVRLSDPVAAFIPEFGKYGKERITIRDLLTHMSGLRPDLDLADGWTGARRSDSTGVGRDAHGRAGPPLRLQRHQLHPARRDRRARVEDAARSVRRATRSSSRSACTRHDVQAAGGAARADRADPVVHARPRHEACGLGAPGGHWPDDAARRRARSDGAADGRRRRPRGLVQHGGGSGRSSAACCSAAACYDGARVLSPLTVARMTSPATPAGEANVRGLGWDLDSSYSSNRGELLPLGSFGHTGFTGTSIWIDPATRVFIVFLSNRVHPDGTGDVTPLRAEVATIVASAVTDLPPERARALAFSRPPAHRPCLATVAPRPAVQRRHRRAARGRLRRRQGPAARVC